MKTITILGSTGSIGTQTLEVVSENNDLKVSAIAAGTNIKMLEEQARKFTVSLVAVWDEDKAEELRNKLADTNIKVVSGMDGLIEAATLPETDIVVGAVVGMIGIIPTIEAIKAHKDIALANKETLVTAGHIIMPLVKEMGVKLLPVDSEHCAIFQCLNGEYHEEVDKILLTASGGPFRGKTRDELTGVTVDQALAHPNWSMGRKITIDSASMVNKGLEVIEAKWLFDVDIDDVTVVVQPESIIHSMVQYKDGAVMAQLGTPDMKLPIQYALFYPHRRNSTAKRIDFATLASINFTKPDMDTFKGLALAYKAGRIGGSMPTVLNAANEKLVAMFLDKKIDFLDIADIIEICMDRHEVIANPTIEEILQVEQDTYQLIGRIVNERNNCTDSI